MEPVIRKFCKGARREEIDSTKKRGEGGKKERGNTHIKAVFLEKRLQNSVQS